MSYEPPRPESVRSLIQIGINPDRARRMNANQVKYNAMFLPGTRVIYEDYKVYLETECEADYQYKLIYWSLEQGYVSIATKGAYRGQTAYVPVEKLRVIKRKDSRSAAFKRKLKKELLDDAI